MALPALTLLRDWSGNSIRDMLRAQSNELLWNKAVAIQNARTVCADSMVEKREGERLGIYTEILGITLGMPVTTIFKVLTSFDRIPELSRYAVQL